MENKHNIFTTTALAFILCILLITFSATAIATATTENEDYGITVYWGRNDSEGSLRSACDSGLYKFINLAYLHISGNGSVRKLDMDGHCFDSFITCPIDIGLDYVLYCQDKGVNVLLSLTGGVSDNATAESAMDLAEHIWNSYLGGWTLVRPLGQIWLDGVDFAFTRGPSAYYTELATALKNYSTAKRKVYVTASPKCRISENNLSPAITAGLFDNVWVQFYNDVDCDFSTGFGAFAVAWKNWYNMVPKGTKLYAGMPASTKAAKSGYVAAEVFVHILPFISSEKFGGVMVWNRNYDKGFSRTVIEAFAAEPMKKKQPISNNANAAIISQVVSV